MKYITAIIRPEKLDKVQKGLDAINLNRLTVSDVQGYGQQKGHKEIFRGTEYEVRFVQKIKLELAVDDAYWEKVVDTITKEARSDEGKVGDGKIFVYELTEAVRVRTGEKGSSAL